MFLSVSIATACGTNRDGSSESINVEAARRVADQAADYYMENNGEKLYEVMGEEFKSSYTLNQLNLVIEQLYEMYGKPVEHKYRHAELGDKLYSSGETKPLAKFRYSLLTTKSANEQYFLVVDVVPEGTDLAVSFLGVTRFIGDIPPWLKSDSG
jgi:hypothetical protein